MATTWDRYRPRRLALGAAAYWALLACGCSSSSATTQPTCRAMAVVLVGTGVATFESVSDGQELPIIRGIQGGYHLAIALRMRNGSGKAVLTVRVSGEHGESIDFPTGLSDTQTSTVQLTPLASSGAPGGEDCWSQALARRVFMPFSSTGGADILPTAQVEHQRIRLDVEVRDASGQLGHATKVVVPVYTVVRT